MNTPDTARFPLPKKSEDILSFLETRRSNLAKVMTEPGPAQDELARILKIAARVPDHRKLSPWRFVIFQGDARATIGHHLEKAFIKNNPDMPSDRVTFEAGRLQRAPLVIAVISSPKDCPRGTPKWEQELSSAAVCFNLCLAAQASGYGAQWLTEWYAYDDDVTSAMGVEQSERIAGLIYIGTPLENATPRPRPDIDSLITHWS